MINLHNYPIYLGLQRGRLRIRLEGTVDNLKVVYHDGDGLREQQLKEEPYFAMVLARTFEDVLTRSMTAEEGDPQYKEAEKDFARFAATLKRYFVTGQYKPMIRKKL